MLYMQVLAHNSVGKDVGGRTSAGVETPHRELLACPLTRGALKPINTVFASESSVLPLACSGCVKCMHEQNVSGDLALLC